MFIDILPLIQCQSGTPLVCHETIFWRLHHVCHSAKQCRTRFRGSCKRGFTNQSETRILGLRVHCHLCYRVFPKNVGSWNVFASWILSEVNNTIHYKSGVTILKLFFIRDVWNCMDILVVSCAILSFYFK